MKKKKKRRLEAQALKKRARKETVSTRHHIFPSSRGSITSEINIKIVPLDYHQAYHKLFINLTPTEIINYLMDMWFNNGTFIKPQDWRDEDEDIN